MPIRPTCWRSRRRCSSIPLPRGCRTRSRRRSAGRRGAVPHTPLCSEHARRDGRIRSSLETRTCGFLPNSVSCCPITNTCGRENELAAHDLGSFLPRDLPDTLLPLDESTAVQAVVDEVAPPFVDDEASSPEDR